MEAYSLRKIDETMDKKTICLRVFGAKTVLKIPKLENFIAERKIFLLKQNLRDFFFLKSQTLYKTKTVFFPFKGWISTLTALRICLSAIRFPKFCI